MKKILQLFVLLFLGNSFINAQNINWSGIMKDNAGNALADTSVSLTFSILEGPTEVLVYREKHNVTTGSAGLVSAEIGAGTPNAGNFATLDFTKPYKLRTEANSGNGNVILGTTDFKAVPLAKSANSAETAKTSERLQKGNSSIEIGSNNQILIRENAATVLNVKNGKLVLPALAGGEAELVQVASDGSLERKPARLRKEYYSIDAAGVHLPPGFEYNRTDGLYNVSGDKTTRFAIPVNLPHGAIITGMTMDFKDDTSQSGIVADLREIFTNRNQALASIVEVKSSMVFRSPNWTSLYSNDVDQSRNKVKNDKSTYFLWIYATDGWTLKSANSELLFNRVIIEYNISY